MRPETTIVTAGRQPEAHYGSVNVPVFHTSTVIFPSLAAHDAAYASRARGERVVTYGLSGTPTTMSLEDAVAALEGGHRAIVYPSGQAAIAGALLTCLDAGDHLLMVDSVYEPTRLLCEGLIKRLNIETTYYDPLIGGDIAKLMRPNTRAVFTESPGSLTFEVQDIPAIAEAAHAGGAAVIMDNTWASPLFFKPFEHGVDLSIQAATKYLSGHSDLVLGTVASTEPWWPKLLATTRQLGMGAGPEEIFMALRGMRTLSVRLHHHQESGLKVARWLAERPEVARILHPALPDDPGHALWKRDFLGATGLFGIELKPCSREALAAMLDHMTLFDMGYSWGGFESLIMPSRPDRCRSVRHWTGGPLLRIHIGLEAVEDLIADLEAGLQRLSQAS